MVQHLSKIGVRFFSGLPEPWHYLFTGKYDRKSHARWAKQPRWRILLEIFGALVFYAITLAALTYALWAVAGRIWDVHP